VVTSAPGLYFVGLAFQYAFASILVGGAGRDAEYVVKHLSSRAVREVEEADARVTTV
jgi:putative flavoprotein involved in K+ transport